jgi:hypothetical protein
MRNTDNTELQALKAHNEKLSEAVREFAGFFSSDDVKHWQLNDLADGRERIEADTLEEYLAKSRDLKEQW